MAKQVLIIDDDPLIRQLLKNYLCNDYDIELKSGGNEAIHWLKSGNVPDLILLDMEMPGMNGRVFIRRIKSSPVHRNIPVVIVSGSTSNILRNSFLKAGAAGYLVKPFQPATLNELLKDILDNTET
jgi:CheY-like chemotaxis protein